MRLAVSAESYEEVLYDWDVPGTPADPQLMVQMMAARRTRSLGPGNGGFKSAFEWMRAKLELTLEEAQRLLGTAELQAQVKAMVSVIRFKPEDIYHPCGFPRCIYGAMTVITDWREPSREVSMHVEPSWSMEEARALEEERDVLAQANSQLVTSRDAYKVRCEALERRNRELMTESWSELQFRIGILKNARDTLGQEKDALLKRVEELQAQMKELEDEKDDLGQISMERNLLD